MFGFKPATKQGLHIMIVGCGKVGTTLVAQLSKEGHDITIVDKNPQKIQDVSNMYDCMGICGNGASFTVQQEAGIDETDLIIAVTESDELNLLCCTVAKQSTNCAAIARVRTPDYNKDIDFIREQLGLAIIINPELEAAREIARILNMPAALEVNSFTHSNAEIVKFKVPQGNILDGLKIWDIGKHVKHNILICGVERGGEVYIPAGSFQLLGGDIVSFVGTHHSCERFFKEIGFETHRVNDTLIIGGSKAGYYLAKQLISSGIKVKVIENNYEHCETLSKLLPEAIIINGDGTDEDLLLEEGIKDVESFVPLTGIDEENIILTLYAKQVSDAKVITKINRITFDSVIDKLDLGSVVYPKYITSEAIIAYVRAKQASKNSNVETLYHLFGSRAEAIEFVIDEESAATGKTLMDLKLKDNLLVCFIRRNGETFIPRGQDMLCVGDRVMIVTKHSGFNELTDILA